MSILIFIFQSSFVIKSFKLKCFEAYPFYSYSYVILFLCYYNKNKFYPSILFKIFHTMTSENKERVFYCISHLYNL